MTKTLNFLFTTAHLGGNVSPILPVLRGLAGRGHAVRLMSDDVNEPDAAAAGVAFAPWRRAPNRASRSSEFDPPDWSVSDREGMGMVAQFLAGTALAYAEDTIAELEREPADLVVNFDMLLGPALGCEARGYKLALLGTMISFFPLRGIPPFGSGLAPARNAEELARQENERAAVVAIYDAALPALNAARAHFGLSPLAHLADQWDAAAMHWLGTARAFDFAGAELRANMRYAGPLLGDPVWAQTWRSPWPAGDTRPLVVAGFSTSFQNHAAVLQRVIDAAAGLPVRLLVTLGGSIDPAALHPSANTVIVESAPHLEVMRQASIVVTHGGHGTVMAALAHGLPLLVIPHGRDQNDNAARVREHGAGLALPREASTPELRSALERLVEEPAFRASAGALGAAILAEARESKLVEQLEALAEPSPVRAAVA